MEKEKFYKVLNKLILPLFTGSVYIGEEKSTSRDAEVAYGKQNSLLIKPSKNDLYRCIIKRSRAFQQFEVNLLRFVLGELNDIAEMHITDESYENVLQQKAIEKAICKAIAPTTADTMLGLITELECWSYKTYEGKKTAFGVVINQIETVNDKKVHYTEIMNKGFIALLSDGERSYIEFDKNGFVLGYVTLASTRNYATTTPNEYEYIARYCNEKRIGIALNANGDLLVFKNRALMFAKRKGEWNVYCHEEIIQLLSYKGNHALKDVRRAVYHTALDCSFAYSGAVLVYLDQDMSKEAISTIDPKDILEEKYYIQKREYVLDESGKLYNVETALEMRKLYEPSYESFLLLHSCNKVRCIRKIIGGKKFYELDRQLREELASMDGAVVIDHDGTIIAVGAILKIDAGSNEGGRLAAAMALAKYGVAIKISQDGQMQGFCVDKKSPNKIKQVFSVR